MNKQTNALEILKLDLSTRKDNTHVGSGLGGNPGELLFLMTHKFNAVHSDTETKIAFNGDDVVVTTNLNGKLNLKDIRTALSKFFTDNSITVPSASFEDLINPEFLKQQKQTPNIITHLDVVNQTLVIKTSLDAKIAASIDSIDDNDKTLFNKLVESSPSSNVLCIRMIIGMNNIIKYNLDEFLTNINKLFEDELK